jgi:hypothetical protein
MKRYKIVDEVTFGIIVQRSRELEVHRILIHKEPPRYCAQLLR